MIAKKYLSQARLLDTRIRAKIQQIETLMELCVAIAEGWPWLGFPCRKGRVLYVNLEIDPASAINRFLRIYKALDVPARHANDIVVWNLRGHAVPLDQLVPKLIRRVRDQRFDAIVIDPIYKVIMGDENEVPATAASEGSYDEIVYCMRCGEELSCEHKTIPMRTYTISETKLMLAVGKTGMVKVTDENGKAVTPDWSSSDKVVADVNSKGNVTAKKIGTAVVTATIDGISLTCDVRVQFTDVTDPTQFYYEPIYNMVDKGVIGGWDDGTFRPTGNCNRAAVVTFLWKLAGKPQPGKMATFKDMTTNEDFNKAISWAAENGITTGYAGNLFKPWNTCNRLAVASFLDRYDKLK